MIILFALLAFILMLVMFKIHAISQQLKLMKSQFSASELLNEDMQANLSLLYRQVELLKKALNDTDIESNQVSKQLEHRIRLQQEEIKTLVEQLGTLSDQQTQDKFYTRANKLAVLGADIEEIMSECELPRAEVETLLAIHKNNQ